MALTPNEAVDLVMGRMWPLLYKEKQRAARIDRWMRWDHDNPHRPRHSTQEYRDLVDRAQAPWGRRVVTAVTDQLYVEGYREAQASDNAAPWRWWQANGLDARQIAVHEAAVGYGLAYTVVLPGKSWLGEKMPVIRGLDPSEMIALYEDPAWDDWPEYALRARPVAVGDRSAWKLRLYDDAAVHHLVMSSGEKARYVKVEAHDVGVCPVVRFTNHLDLRGRADGDIEPIIPVLGRIDQTVFDRLVVQRFTSWVVRTIAGMSPPEKLPEGETEEAYRTRTKLRLAVEDILVADDPETKFGSLPATPLSGFIEAHDADVRALAALSQSPAHELVGQMSNLSAESLAAAEASLTRRVTRVKHPLGESWEQTLRLGARIMGDDEAARDIASQMHWRDMESRSLAQAADALGKLATMLGVPVEVLWEKIPGWTQQDVERAKAKAAEAGGIDQLMQHLLDGATPPVPAGN